MLGFRGNGDHDDAAAVITLELFEAERIDPI